MELESVREQREEKHAELLARNVFWVIMLGAVGFVTMCATVIFQ